MAMQFDLVSPERKLASIQADAVEIPGSDGDFTAMEGHAPFMATLRPGLVKVTAGSDVTEYLVTGGFVEVSAEATSLLAERAMPKSEVTSEFLTDLAAELEETAASHGSDQKDTLMKRANEVRTLIDQL